MLGLGKKKKPAEENQPPKEAQATETTPAGENKEASPASKEAPSSEQAQKKEAAPSEAPTTPAESAKVAPPDAPTEAGSEPASPTETALKDTEKDFLTLETELRSNLEEKLEKVEETADYFYIKVPKSTPVLVFGIVILLAWLGLTAQFVYSRFIKPSETPSVEQPVSTSPTIRLKDSSSSESAAAEVVQLLEAAGFSSVEVIKDDKDNNDQVTVAVKPDKQELHQQLITLLQGYPMASAEATLSDDSNFDAVIVLDLPSTTE